MIYYYKGPNKDEVVIQEDDLKSLVSDTAFEWARRLVGTPVRCAPGLPTDMPKEWKWDDPCYSEYRNWIDRMDGLRKTLYGIYVQNRDTVHGPFHIECEGGTYNIVADGKAAQEATKRLPSSMKELAAELACPGKISKYDFGTRSITKSAPRSSEAGAKKAWKYVTAFAIARALIARENGVEYTTADIAASCREDWNTLAWFKYYRAVLPEPEDPTGNISCFMDKTVECDAQYLQKFKGNKWSAPAYITWLRNSKYDLKPIK